MMKMKLNDEEVLTKVIWITNAMRDEDVPRRPRTVPKLKHPERPVTGNLKYDALKVEVIAPHTFRVFIDQDIAPYMPYTNEPWISPKWKGTPNPNEKWWEEFCQEFLNKLTAQLSGELRRKG